MTSSRHQVWLEAHYALGRHEAALGHTLTEKDRRAFIQAYIAEYEDQNPAKID
jgi:hypothetical protein